MVKRWAVLLLAVGALSAPPGVAHALEVANGSAVRNNTGTSISAWDNVTACWRTIKSTINGYLRVQNNPIYRPESTSLLNTTLTAGQLFQTNTPLYAQDIEKVTLAMSWAVADTDSFAVEVYVIGKISGTAADGFDFPIDMNPATKRLDGIIVGSNRSAFYNLSVQAGADSTGMVWACNQACPPNYIPVGTAGQGSIAAPGNAPRMAGLTASGASFSICPRSGPPPVFSYYSFWVMSLRQASQANVTMLGLVRGN